MAWTTPKTWAYNDLVSAADLNTYLRDNQNLLKTQIDDEGGLMTLLKGFAFSSGQSSSGTIDTQLTSYNVTIPADFLDQPGDGLLIEGTFVTHSTAGTKTGRMTIDAATKITFLVTTGTSDVIPFRLTLRRRTSTTASLTGIAWHGAAAGGSPTPYLCNGSFTGLDFTSSQTLEIWAQTTVAAATLKLSDYMVDQGRGVIGSTV